MPILYAAAPVRGDQVFTLTRNERDVRIVGLEGGNLLYRRGGGNVQSTGIADVVQIVVDQGGMFDDFNQAERFVADKQPQRAIIRYRRFLRLARDFWSNLASARLVMACNAANQLDEAIVHLLPLLRSGPDGVAAAVRVLPASMPPVFDKRATRAIQQIDAALVQDHNEAERVVLELLRFEILRATQQGQSARAARRAAGLSIPAAVRHVRTYRMQLRAIEAVLDDQRPGSLVADVNRVIENCPEAVLPDALLLKGRLSLAAASTREEMIRAAWPSLRVPIHFPDHPRAAEGLYRAAEVLERLGRTNKALALLDECLQHERVSEEIKSQAEDYRRRLIARLEDRPSPADAEGERGQ